MKTVLLSFYTNPRYAKVFELGKLITITGGAQIIVQIMGFVSSVITIRLLSINEYATYTLANTMLGTMTLLSDSGISTGVLSESGKVWKDKKKLGIVLHTGLQLRKKFAIITSIISTPILLYILLKQDSGLLASILIIVALIPSFYASLSDSLLEIAPKLNQDILPIQKNQLYVNFGRLVLCCVTLFVFPFAAVAIVTNSLPRMYGNIQLKKLTEKHIEKENVVSKEISKKIVLIIKRSLPAVIYYCLSGQISIWLLSFFSTTKALAQIGAIGRVSIIFGLIFTILSTIIIPRFTRLKNEKYSLLNKYFQVICLMMNIYVLITILIFLFTPQLLWVLGEKYKNLGKELLLFTVSSCFNAIGSCAFAMYSSKGWIIKPLTSIILSILPNILGIVLFDVSKIDGVLMLSIVSSVGFMILHTTYGVIKIMRLNSHE